MTEQPKPDAELDLLKMVQARGKERKLAVLERLSAAFNLPIEEHLGALASDLARCADKEKP